MKINNRRSPNLTVCVVLRASLFYLVDTCQCKLFQTIKRRPPPRVRVRTMPVSTESSWLGDKWSSTKSISIIIKKKKKPIIRKKKKKANNALEECTTYSWRQCTYNRSVATPKVSTYENIRWKKSLRSEYSPIYIYIYSRSKIR